MAKKMSVAASEILEGLNEALMDAKGIPVDGVKKASYIQYARRTFARG